MSSRADKRLLAIARERGCERELADALSACLEEGQLPGQGRLPARFAADPTHLPNVVVNLAALDAYEAPIVTLHGSNLAGDAA